MFSGPECRTAGDRIATVTGFGPTPGGIGTRMKHSDGPVSITGDGFTKRVAGVGYLVLNGRRLGFPGAPGPNIVAGRRSRPTLVSGRELESVVGVTTLTVL